MPNIKSTKAYRKAYDESQAFAYGDPGALIEWIEMHPELRKQFISDTLLRCYQVSNNISSPMDFMIAMNSVWSGAVEHYSRAAAMEAVKDD